MLPLLLVAMMGLALPGESFLLRGIVGRVYHDRKVEVVSRIGRTRVGLDLQDILDDEVDFLAQLRRQMENPLNASPREVTNRIKSFFASSRRSEEEMQAFRAYLQTNLRVMDVVNAILLLEGCDRSGVALRELVSWGDLLKAMEKPSTLLTSSMIYRGINAMRRMRSDDNFTKRYLGLLMQRVEDSSMVLHGTDICPAIYSMQNFNANMPEIRRLLLFFAKSLSMTNVLLSSKSVCSALFGLKRMKAVPEVRAVLQQLARKIESSDTFYHSVNVCIGLNGLQCMDDGAAEVRAVLRALVSKAIPAEEQGVDQATDREISMALFGIQRMGGHRFAGPTREGHWSDASPELRGVVKYVTSLLEHSKGEFEAKRMGLCVLGLSGLSSDTPEVRPLVRALAEKAKSAWGDMNGQELSMCLHGLAGMRSETPEVVQLVSNLTPLVKKCPSISGLEISSALSGLQSLNSKVREVNVLVNNLAELIERSNSTLSGMQFARALSGLQGLSSSKPEVRRLLTALTSKVQPSSAEGLSGRDLSQALFGMKSLNSQNEETLQVVRMMKRLLDEFRDAYPAPSVAIALCGMQKLRADNKDVKQLLLSLASFIRLAEGTMPPKSISMAINGLQGIDSRSPEALTLLEALAEVVERSEGQGAGFGSLNEVCSAIAGFSLMSADQKPVYRLLCSVARLSESSSAIANLKSQDVRGERLTAALYGLQGCGGRSQPARDILRLLTPSIREMSSLKGKELGMAFQGFKECQGKPSEEHAAALEALAPKVKGWSASKSSSASEVQITLRSALWGLSKLDRRYPAVRSALAAIAAEVLVLFENDNMAKDLDPKTLNTLREVYRGGDLDTDATISRMLQTAGIDYKPKSRIPPDAAAKEEM